MTDRPVGVSGFSEEQVEKAARALYAAMGKAAPWEALAENMREEARDRVRAVLASVDAVPREDYDSLAEMFEAVSTDWNNCEAQARAYREALERVAEFADAGVQDKVALAHRWKQVRDIARSALSPDKGGD